MNLWFVLWFLLSVVLIGATVWNTVILYRQKKAWSDFAKKHGLTFRRGTLMGPASVQGMVRNFEIGLFTAEQRGDDLRKRKVVSVIEIIMPEGLEDSLVTGTPEMLPFMKTLDALHSYQIENKDWNNQNRIFIDNDEGIVPYLTDERITAMHKILSTKNADVLIIFNATQGVVRVETPAPLLSVDVIDSALKRLLALSDVLRRDDVRQKQAASKAVETPSRTVEEQGDPDPSESPSA